MVEHNPSRRTETERRGLYRRRFVPNPKDPYEPIELFSQSVAGNASAPSWRKRLHGNDPYIGVVLDDRMFYWISPTLEVGHRTLMGMVASHDADYVSFHSYPVMTDPRREIVLFSEAERLKDVERDAIRYLQRSLGRMAREVDLRKVSRSNNLYDIDPTIPLSEVRL